MHMMMMTSQLLITHPSRPIIVITTVQSCPGLEEIDREVLYSEISVRRTNREKRARSTLERHY